MTRGRAGSLHRRDYGSSPIQRTRVNPRAKVHNRTAPFPEPVRHPPRVLIPPQENSPVREYYLCRVPLQGFVSGAVDDSWTAETGHLMPAPGPYTRGRRPGRRKCDADVLPVAESKHRDSRKVSAGGSTCGTTRQTIQAVDHYGAGMGHSVTRRSSSCSSLQVSPCSPVDSAMGKLLVLEQVSEVDVKALYRPTGSTVRPPAQGSPAGGPGGRAVSRVSAVAQMVMVGGVRCRFNGLSKGWRSHSPGVSEDQT